MPLLYEMMTYLLALPFWGLDLQELRVRVQAPASRPYPEDLLLVKPIPTSWICQLELDVRDLDKSLFQTQCPDPSRHPGPAHLDTQVERCT